MIEVVDSHILDFHGEWKLAKYPPEENGYYMTIRCGLGGIYTKLNEWKDNKWQIGILDDSDVIAYSREQITKEQIKEWVKSLMEKYHKEENKLWEHQRKFILLKIMIPMDFWTTGITRQQTQVK